MTIGVQFVLRKGWTWNQFAGGVHLCSGRVIDGSQLGFVQIQHFTQFFGQLQDMMSFF